MPNFSMEDDVALLYYKEYRRTGDTVSYLKTQSNGDGNRMTLREAKGLYPHVSYELTGGLVVLTREYNSPFDDMTVRRGDGGWFETILACPGPTASRESLVRYCDDLLAEISRNMTVRRDGPAPPRDDFVLKRDVEALLDKFNNAFAQLLR
jgi:hypothetical protein